MTAATIPRIKAADEPARIDASLEGAEVEEDDGVRVAELWVEVELISLKLWLVVLLLVLVKVAELKVEFRTAAVPVTRAPLMLVMLAVPLLSRVVEAAAEDAAALLVEELSSPPSTEKRPE